tara:strand:+ start:805 stop:1044 length:240 start_codon:yes stop_codon:yes gene_type:complete
LHIYSNKKTSFTATESVPIHTCNGNKLSILVGSNGQIVSSAIAIKLFAFTHSCAFVMSKAEQLKYINTFSLQFMMKTPQ